MALKASLVISGDAAQATAALGQVDAALERNTASAKRAGAANDDLARKTTSATRQASAGYTLLGQQAQDVAIQLQMGTNIGTIVAQQGGQVASAVSMMGGRFAGLASFLAGPWGAAVLVGGGVLLNTLIPALFGATEAAETNAEALGKVAAASDGLGKAQSTLAGMFDLTTGAIGRQNGILRANIQLMALQMRGEALQAKSTAQAGATSAGQASTSRILAGIGTQGGKGAPKFAYGNTIAKKKIDDVLAGRADAATTLKWAETADFSGVSISREDFYNAVMRAAEVGPKNDIADAIERSLTGGRLDPMFIKPGTGRKSATRSATGSKGPDLGEFGEDTAAKIARIVDQFSGLPPIVAQSNQAMRQLDDIASDVEKKRPPNYDALKTSIAGARGAIEANLTKPLDEFLERAGEVAAIDALMLGGKEDQARAMQVVFQLQRQMGPLTEEQLGTVLATVAAERERGDLLDRQQEKIGRYLDATRSIRGELEAMMMGESPKFGQIFKRLQAQFTVERIFGDALREIDDAVKSSFGRDVDTLEANTRQAGAAALDFADTITRANQAIARGVMPVGSSAGAAAVPDDAWDAFLGQFDEAMNSWGEIVVTGLKQTKAEPPRRDTVGGMTPIEYADLVGAKLAGPIVAQLELLGIQLPGWLANALGGVMAGGAMAGPIGAVLGGIKGLGLKGAAGTFANAAFEGAIQGAVVNSVMGALGVKTSKTGAVIGGALFGPLGGIVGGLLGGMFKKTKKGAVSIGNLDGEGAITGTTGNSTSRKEAATSAGSGVNDVLAQFVDRLGGTLGDYAVAIGIRGKDYRVSASGSAAATTKKKTSGDIIYKGKSEEDAVKAALANAIADGAVEGVSAAVQRALQAKAGDIDRALAEALKVQELETLLGGVTGEIDKAFADFERQARERLRIATAYGFDVVKVEELNAKQRLKLSEKLLDEQVGSLQRLIDEMTGGSLFEGTAIDRRAALLDQIATAKSAADAGEEGAADKLAGLLEQLNAVSKDVYGTTGGFASDRTTIIDQARDVIAKANQRIAEAQAKSDPALATTNAALDENNDQNARIIDGITGTNARLDALISVPNAEAVQRLIGLARTGAAL